MHHPRLDPVDSLPSTGSARFFAAPFAVRSVPVDRHAQVAGLVAVGVGGAATLAIFGLPPIDLHTPLHHLGIMDPLCGMTRAVRFAARGDLRDAFGYNPGVFVLIAVAVAMVARTVLGRTTGRWIEITIVRPRFVRIAAATFVVILWVNQQVHATHLS